MNTYKNQTKCYRNMQGKHYINGCDLYYGETENQKIISEMKLKFGKKNIKIITRAKNEKAIFILESIWNKYCEDYAKGRKLKYN